MNVEKDIKEFNREASIVGFQNASENAIADIYHKLQKISDKLDELGRRG